VLKQLDDSVTKSDFYEAGEGWDIDALKTEMEDGAVDFDLICCLF
jgi:hypothetical protein